MNKPRVVVYDAEIEKAILGPQDKKIPGIEYCDGWEDFYGMGISVVGAWDSKYDIYRIFDERSKHKFDRLVQKADYLVGYQSIKFDNPLIQSCWRIHMPGLKVLDFKTFLMKKEASDKDTLPVFLYKTLSLSKMAEINGLYTKLEHGAMSPVLWQQGFIAEVINYCLHDVELVVQLIRLAKIGDLVSSRTKSFYPVFSELEEFYTAFDKE